jgi:hypothetical protein
MSVVPAPVRRFLQAVGVNRAVAYALMGDGTSMLIKPLTLVLIASCLTEQEQGYYFAFGAFVGLQGFFDLGLGMATLQFVSHEAGHLSWGPDGTLGGDPVAKSRLISVMRLSLLWYSVVAAVLAVTLLVWGWVYFAAKDTGGIVWGGAWVWTAVATAAGLITVPLIQFLAACGKMAETSRVLAVQKVGTSLLQCLVLVIGGGLLSWPVAQTLGLTIIAYWLFAFWRPTFRDLLRQPADGPKVDWWREVWPFQWRVAVSGLSFYLTSQVFTLMLFDDTDAGKAEAGRMGASLQVMNVLISASMIWIGARVPTFGHLTARRDWDRLDQVFRRAFVQGTLVAAAAAVGAWSVFILLRFAGYALGGRVLPALPLGLLLANVVVQTMFSALHSYMRAHKRDPFVALTIAFTLAMTVAVFTVGREFGSLGMAAALLLLNTVICLGGGWLVFLRCRRTWHAETTVAVTEPTPV